MHPVTRLWRAVTIAATLGALSIAVPIVNADAGPPRALFLHLPGDRPEPSVSLRAVSAADGHWVLAIDTTGFRFTAVCLANAQAAPVGHAHVLRGDTKIATAYAPEIDLGPLAPGSHTFQVVLRGQDHRALLGRSGLIAASVTVAVPPASTAQTVASVSG